MPLDASLPLIVSRRGRNFSSRERRDEFDANAIRDRDDVYNYRITEAMSVTPRASRVMCVGR